MKLFALALRGSIATGALVASALAVPATAQERTYSFSIPAQDLKSSLRALARASGQQITYDGRTVEGKRAPALQGSYTVRDGLTRLLAASGLEASWGRSGVIVVRPAVARAIPSSSDDGTETGTIDGIEEIVVTAGKRVERLSEVGGAVSAVTGDTLRNLGANSIQDYLGFTPGVSLNSYGRPGQTEISIRGISAQSVGPASAIYIDEIPFGQSSNEAQGAAYAPDIDPSDLERVEVLKGPQGTLYGASSLGGLVKYVTRQPNLTDTSAEVAMDLTSVEHGGLGAKARASASAPLVRDKVGLRVSGFYRLDPGYVDNITLGRRDVNRGDSWGARAALLIKPVDALEIKLGALLQNNRGDSMNEVDYNTGGNPPPPFVPFHGDLKNSRYIEQPSSVKNRIYSAELHYDFGWGNLVSATGLTRQRIDRVLDVTRAYGLRYTYLGVVPGQGRTIGLNASYDIDKFTQEVRLQSAQNRKFEWAVGGFYQRETSDTLSAATAREANGDILASPNGQPVYSAGQNHLREYAGFVNGTFYITPEIDISGGYRHSRIEQSNDKQTTGIVFDRANPTLVVSRTDPANEDVDTYSAAIRWRVSPSFLLYARAANGYRPGGSRTLPPAGVAAGLDPTYRSDSVWSYEIGAKGRAFDGRMTFDLDMFQLDWSDIQNLALVDGFFVQSNAGTARSRGIEAEIQAKPFNALSLSASFGYIDAVFTQGNDGLGINPGDPLSGVSRYMGSVRGEYRTPIGGEWEGFLGADARYRSSQIDAAGLRLPDYTLVGLRIGAETPDVRLSLFVQNLTDERALLGNTIGLPRPGVPYSIAVAQPRTFGLSFSKRW
ncbi:TonB-dependent receptor domain-containing protein [Sphingopyxis panaciterrae]